MVDDEHTNQADTDEPSADSSRPENGELTDEQRGIVELYARLLVQCRDVGDATADEAVGTGEALRETIGSIVDGLDEYGNVFVGLTRMDLVAGEPFVYRANQVVLALVLADALGLDGSDTTRCGLAAAVPTYGPGKGADSDEPPRGGDQQHFEANLDSVRALLASGMTDIDSGATLVTTYERGFHADESLPATWYDDEPQPHLLTRLLDVVRQFDLLTRGVDEFDPMKADGAFQTMLSEAGARYDSGLIKLFVTTVGLYPAGTLVKLSDGRAGVVVQRPELVGPDDLFGVTRPTIHTLDDRAERIDLSDDAHVELHIEAVLDAHERDHPGVGLLFSE